MKEFLRNSPKEIPTMESVKEHANCPENDSLILFSRVSHPTIQNQIIDFITNNELYLATTGETVLSFDENDNPIMDEQGEYVMKKIPHIPKSQEVVKQEFLARLHEVETSTSINFDGNGPDIDTIPVRWSLNGKQQGVKTVAVVEAHEKGHRLRPYAGDYFDSYFARGFDFGAISYSEDELTQMRKEYTDTDDATIRRLANSYLLRATEIAERMSQLKNYFGMKSDEKFTASHLGYARTHYIEDTGLDNQMKQFFQAITPNTESLFLEIINSVGI